MDRSILQNCEIIRVANATAAGTSDINGTVVDMQGFAGVICIAALGALTATQVTKLIAESSTVIDGSGDAFAQIATTTAAADADGTKLFVLEVWAPRERFIRFTVDRGTANAVLDSLVVIKYRAQIVPTTQGSTVAASATAYDV
jgi:predicted cobalt transporter CbtA